VYVYVYAFLCIYVYMHMYICCLRAYIFVLLFFGIFFDDLHHILIFSAAGL
jgi:hypothetical protein